MEECKWGYSKGTCTALFIEALFIISKLWKQTIFNILPADEWIMKMWYLYTMEFYLHKEELNFVNCR
jgi:hypothetical protein